MMQKLSMVLFGILTFMLLARIFTPQKFGIWGLFIIISSIVEMLRHALIKNGYILFINTCKEIEKSAYEYSALLANCVFSAVLCVFFFFTGNLFESLFNSPGIAIVLKYYSVTLLFLVPFTQREFFLLARMNFKGIFFMYFLRNGLFMLVSVFLYITKTDIYLGNLAIIYGASALVGVLIGFSIGKYQKIDFTWNYSIFLKFLNYGRFILGTNFFALIFRNTDSFMTARFISPIGLAFYNSASRVINFAEMPVLVFSEMMLPKAAHIIRTGNETNLKYMYEKTVSAILTLIIPFIIITWIFAEQIILILAGSQYLEASSVLRVMVFYAFFLPFTSQFGNLMDSTGRQRINFRVMLIFAVINIGSNYYFISEFGLLGAAFGTLFTYCLLFIVIQTILVKHAKVSHLNILRNIISLYPEYFKLILQMLNKFSRAGRGFSAKI